MEINRQNYETIFLLYIDNELSLSERGMVEDFIHSNPDLAPELDLLKDAVLVPAASVSFANKESLLRTESGLNAGLITDENCEEYFIMYADQELSNEQNAMVEGFVYKNPKYQEHFELIQQCKLEPENIVFRDKQVLYKHERSERVVPMFFYQRARSIAAAVVVFFLLSVTFWYISTQTNAPDAQNGIVDLQEKGVNKPDQKTPGIDQQTPGIDQQVAQNDPKAPTGKEEIVSDRKDNNELNVADANRDRATDNKFRKPTDNKSAGEPLIAATEKVREGSEADQPSGSVSIVKDTKLAPAAPTKANTLAAAIIVKEPSGSSNILSSSNVQQGRSDLKGNAGEERNRDLAELKKRSVELAGDESQTASEEVAIGPVTLKQTALFASLNNADDETVSSSQKKNRMRGFFRKVTRVLDKATNKDLTEERKELNIAGFAIAL